MGLFVEYILSLCEVLSPPLAATLDQRVQNLEVVINKFAETQSLILDQLRQQFHRKNHMTLHYVRQSFPNKPFLNCHQHQQLLLQEDECQSLFSPLNSAKLNRTVQSQHQSPAIATKTHAQQFGPSFNFYTQRQAS